MSILNTCGDSTNGNTQAQLVGKGILSTSLNEAYPMEDPQTGDLWYSVYEKSFDEQTIYWSPKLGKEWDWPRKASFSGVWGDRAPRFSPDGKWIYFTSNRPVGSDSKNTEDLNIWRVKREGRHKWSAPELISNPVNVQGAADMHCSVISQENLYLVSSRPESYGKSDIFQVKDNGRYVQVQHLNRPLNDTLSQSDIYVHPSEKWMIIVITDSPSGYGGDDLYFSKREEEGWSAPKNLGTRVNSEEYEYGPSLSADGKYLYFTSHKNGSADLFRIELMALNLDFEAE